MGAEQLVFLVALFEYERAAAGAEVEHEGDAAVGEVYEVAVAIAAGHQDGVALIIREEDVLGQLHGRHGGAAAVLHVDAPGAAGADAVLDIAGGGGEGVLLPLLAEAEDGVYLHGVDAGVLQAVQSRERAHLLRAVAGLVGGNALLTYAQFVYDGVLGPGAAGSLGYLLGRHVIVRKVNSYSNYAHGYVVHISSRSILVICERSFTLS